jgi:hypothetical protein
LGYHFFQRQWLAEIKARSQVGANLCRRNIRNDRSIRNSGFQRFELTPDLIDLHLLFFLCGLSLIQACWLSRNL